MWVFCDHHCLLCHHCLLFVGIDNELAPSQSLYAHHTPTPSPKHASSPKRRPSTDTSVAVKVLRSVSSLLLPPLLDESEHGFSQELYKKIIIAVQKISWRVEACLSYSYSDKDINIHNEIFDEYQRTKVQRMMIASPPEEHKLQDSPAHVMVQSAMVSNGYNRSKDGFKSRSASPVEGTYFRPTIGRRTTISVSKRHVQNLGLNSVNLNAIDNLPSQQLRSRSISTGNCRIESHDDSVLDLHTVRDRVLQKLSKEFPHLKASSPVDGGGPSKMRVIPSQLYDECGSIDTLLSTPCLSPSPSEPGHQRYAFSPQSEDGSFSPLRERTLSLEFDHINDTSPVTVSPLTKSVSPDITIEHRKRGSMPVKQTRRGTLYNLFKGKKKSASFGKADLFKKQLKDDNWSPSKFFPHDQNIAMDEISRGAYSNCRGTCVGDI